MICMHQHYRAAALVLTVFLSSFALPIQGFTFQQSLTNSIHHHDIKRTSVVLLTSSKESSSTSSGKGFSKNNSKAKPTTTLPTPLQETEEDSSKTILLSSSSSSSSITTTKTAGQEALDRLRQADMQRRNEEFKSMQQLQEVDQSLKDDPSLAVIPEKVAMRMGKRMLPFVGLPLFGSMITFVLFWYLATYKDIAVPTALVAYATIAILVVGLMGITYSVMSASWDEDREGSTIGWEEFQRNLSSVKDGLQRSRENAVLRDKLSALSEEEKARLKSD